MGCIFVILATRNASGRGCGKFKANLGNIATQISFLKINHIDRCGGSNL